MKDGWFTGKKLNQFIKGELADFENARTIINGHDKAQPEATRLDPDNVRAYYYLGQAIREVNTVS